MFASMYQESNDHRLVARSLHHKQALAIGSFDVSGASSSGKTTIYKHFRLSQSTKFTVPFETTDDPRSNKCWTCDILIYMVSLVEYHRDSYDDLGQVLEVLAQLEIENLAD